MISDQMLFSYYEPMLRMTNQQGEYDLYISNERVGKIYNAHKVSFNYLRYWIKERMPDWFGEGGLEEFTETDLFDEYWEDIEEGFWDGKRDQSIC